MYSTTTNGIEIKVEVFFQKENSNTFLNDFSFAYRVSIINNNHFAIQLLRRTWHIFDSNGEHKTVEGEGVVGISPVILSGKAFTYVSGCNLKSEMGKMHGFYTIKNLQNNRLFEVTIPSFEMIVPNKLN